MELNEKKDFYYYYVFEEWMETELKLKNAALKVFAYIYGMNVRSGNKFYANQQFLMNKLHLSKGSVNSALKTITEMEYVRKIPEYQQGFVKKYSYEVNIQKIDTLVNRAARLNNLKKSQFKN